MRNRAHDVRSPPVSLMMQPVPIDKESSIVRKILIALVATTATVGIAIPATAAQDTTKPTGAKCVERAQKSDKLSEAGKAQAVTACNERATAIREARADLHAARTKYRAAAKAAKTSFREAAKAQQGKSKDERKAALTPARADRKAALKAARSEYRTAKKAYRTAVKAAKKKFRAAIKTARAA